MAADLKLKEHGTVLAGLRKEKDEAERLLTYAKEGWARAGKCVPCAQ